MAEVPMGERMAVVERGLADHVTACAQLQRDVVARLRTLEKLVWAALGATGILGSLFYIVGDKILHLLSR